ncbi:hypothetical protein NCCP28_12870 [Niallia sp. NCCP-28]|nr:hypothetical protein NCCP28_12870 [Niallia sp. NCCP-28]
MKRSLFNNPDELSDKTLKVTKAFKGLSAESFTDFLIHYSTIMKDRFCTFPSLVYNSFRA